MTKMCMRAAMMFKRLISCGLIMSENIRDSRSSSGVHYVMTIDPTSVPQLTQGLVKYLQSLQKIAKENAETGQFRTSLQPKEMSSSCTSSSATGCSVITSAALDNSQLEKVNKIEWET